MFLKYNVPIKCLAYKSVNKGFRALKFKTFFSARHFRKISIQHTKLYTTSVKNNRVILKKTLPLGSGLNTYVIIAVIDEET